MMLFNPHLHEMSYPHLHESVSDTRWCRVSKLIMPQFSSPKVTLVSIFVDQYLVPVLF
jgi:hypothetical protein